MTVGIVRILRKLPSSPNTSGRATLTKKSIAAGVKSITLNEKGWRFQSEIRTFRTPVVFCLKGRMGRSRIDRVKQLQQLQMAIIFLSTTKETKKCENNTEGSSKF
ncbi:hypothetical protein AVEN_216489-1 [Araneus ventricosus]|uniref:Uncharacterized protein n=1 Tax=Araneus ventricosus TaxID=182803 RepID=A0A4Y2BLP9_ARAVE|nr:hypothetical protein AVEN_216489-1 [Araneus ventricosus]